VKKTSFGKIKLGRLAVAVTLCVLMLSTAVATTIGISIKTASKINLNEDSLSYTFLFKEPNFKSVTADGSDYTFVEIPGSMTMAKTGGQPALPVHFATILLPPKTEITSIDFVGIQGTIDTSNVDLNQKPVFPYQHSVPIGSNEPQEFEIDESIYSSDVAFPSALNSDYNIGYSRGYSILNFGIYPIQYNPSEATLTYYSEVAIKINLKETDHVNEFFRNNPEDKAWVEKLVYNPEVTDMYNSGVPTFEYPGGLCDPSGNYDYVIITTTQNGLDYWDTSGSMPYNWESLMDKHASDDGLSCTLVTVQDIDACTDYHGSNPFNDQQAHIREFCKDAYEDWGTSYILIGGDGESSYIPARDMDTNYETDIDADIYWSNLDNNFNADSDNYWGEEGDSGFDLYAELFIGRVTCDTPQDVSNWLTKSFYYADSTEDVYLDNAAFYGGDTGWNCQGDDFIDYSAIKGTDDWLGPIPGSSGPFPTWAGFQYGFQTWNAVNAGNEFDISVAWTAEPPNPGWQGGSGSAAINGFKTAINNDLVTVISGIAHADPSMSLDVDSTDWESQYHNTKPFFMHDYGCHCGDFDAADDGVLHSMLFHSDTELAFACVYNTGYGWGQFDDTNSSSAFQAKEFWSYFLDMENKSGDFGNWQLGKAHAWSKDRMAPTIGWDYSYGTWRAIIQGCLLFGDPAQLLKTPHPSDPPAKPAKPSGKTNGIWFEEYTYSSSATDPNGDQVYYLFDWDDGSSDLVGPYTSGQTGMATHAWTVLGTYEVRVKAKDIWGAGSPWSDKLTVVITDNNPPTAPVVQGPTSGKPGVQYLYNLVSTDAENHEIYYFFDWGDGTTSDWFGPYDSGEAAHTTHSWAEAGTYVVKAKAKDVMGGESDWTTISVTMPLNINGMKSLLLYNLILLRHQTIS